MSNHSAQRTAATPGGLNDIIETDGSHVATDGTVSPELIARYRTQLKSRTSEDVYKSWFTSLDIDLLAQGAMTVSVATKFLRNWVSSHYADILLDCARAIDPSVARVDIIVRTPTPIKARPVGTLDVRNEGGSGAAPIGAPMRPSLPPRPMTGAHPQMVRSGTFDGSPLDPRCTFDNFLVGPSNRMAHAAAVQVAETIFAEERAFNPLFLHAPVGLGKTHLMHAIAWDVQRRYAGAVVYYMTAERFRIQFVEAIRSQDAMAFKDRLRSVDILLIDDFEFLQGDKTEQEFEHLVNTLIDSGRQVVVAAARPPAQIERLNERMRSRLSRGLVVEVSSLDQELRQRILERRVVEKRAIDPLFDVPRAVLELLSERLTENGRELEGAINRLYATWKLQRSPITPDAAEATLRDLVLQGSELRRVKIEDILRAVSRQYAVSKQDILSQRRHRSVVWPRQIGMYLAKQLTSRSLPEIGRRFGDRDHTTVLHAIRKIDKELENNTRLRDEIEDLKRQLNR
jgi:chromosomal replication initiator protein